MCLRSQVNSYLLDLNSGRVAGQYNSNIIRRFFLLFLGKDPVLPSDTDVHTVASILKMYLRELPEPVIPFENFGPLIATIERKEITIIIMLYIMKFNFLCVVQ